VTDELGIHFDSSLRDESINSTTVRGLKATATVGSSLCDCKKLRRAHQSPASKPTIAGIHFFPSLRCGMLRLVETLRSREIAEAVENALSEDIGPSDVTTASVIAEETQASAQMRARERLVLAGIEFAEAAFRHLSSELRMERLARDGDHLAAGASFLRVAGQARSILSAERVALNFVQRLSGIATLTARFVEAVKGTRARILDTRKTTPGWRRFEKYAVACGGGQNHRQGLFDMVLIKDNHLAALRYEPPNAIEAAVRRARKAFPNLKVEVEADTPQQVEHALFAGADVILLDNMSPEELRTAVVWIGGKAKTEASGGVTLETVRAIAETGVDYISVGALTHSARAVDIALDFQL
jgi:nicotinate-nucleotide pyrophosphorylase (carboxylating)